MTAERNEIEIAVIGMAGRFPGAGNLDEFWRNLRDGRESVRFYEPDELREIGVDESVIADPDYVPAWAELEERDYFDARFFRLPPSEAARLSPQHRVFLEIAWHALEDAGIDPNRRKETIGLYCGAGMNTYMLHNELGREMIGPDPFPAYFANGHDFLATRTAYKLNLRGPAITVQTACSTSLTAVHLACQSILSGECDIALAGGTAVIPHPRPGYFYREGGTLSPDGHCRAFDSRAKGTIPGSGGGVVVLKSLEEALAGGDMIHGIIRASAVNNDGSDKIGYTAPSARGQEIVIREALGLAEVDPRSIAYIETHGTGTVLGDPIEIAALRSVYPASGEAYCALGSVKTNIGHLDAAAGIAGFIKTILSLKHGVIPPSLNCEDVNPELQLEGSPFFINTRAREWENGDGPRRAGLSSFGIGGTNVHMILQEAPAMAARESPSANEREKEILFFSARDEAALDAMSENLAEFLAENPDVRPADAAHALDMGRSLFEHRRAVICESRDQAIRLLRERPPARVMTGFAESRDPRLVLLFPGQGAQYPGMGRALYEWKEAPVFRETLDECAEILEPLLGLDIRETMFSADNEDRLRRTENLQPALFALETAVGRYWLSRGLRPVGMLGHSLGEFTAACLAGVFELRDALTIVTARGRLMGEMPRGTMLSVALSESRLNRTLGAGALDEISIAAVNAEERITLSGPINEIARVMEQLRENEIDLRELETSHAFHSAMMDGAMAPFRKVLENIRFHEPSIPFISSVSGDWITAEEARDAEYWVKQMRAPVQFARGLKRIRDLGDPVLLECGPGAGLSSFARRAGDFAVNCMPSPRDKSNEHETMLHAEARLRLAGLELARSSALPTVRLPLYPFQREYYRLPELNIADAKTDGGLLHIPVWTRAPLAPSSPGNEKVLILANEFNSTASAMFRGDRNTMLALEASSFREDDGVLHIPFHEDGLDRLFARLEELEFRPTRVLVLLGESADASQSSIALDASLETYLAFPLALIRRLAKHTAEDSCRIIFAANGIFDVTGGESPRPEAALLQGPVLTAPSEYTNLDCRLLDLDTPLNVESNSGDSAHRTSEKLRAEMFADHDEKIIALRGPHRWARRVEAMASPSPMSFRENGIYMVLGGTGGIGLEIARELAENSAAGLALVSRNGMAGPYEDLEKKIQELRDLGAKVIVERADIADAEALGAALRRIESELGPVNGVVHAAGIPAGGVIELKTTEAMRKVLAPRLLGAVHLEKIFRGHPLDFMVFCSSVSAISGGLGQADYAAANGFLDAFANFQSGETKILSINWDAWRDVGMAARANDSGFDSSGHFRAASPTHVTNENFPGEIIHRDADGIEFAGLLRVTDNWLLNEHRLNGRALVPGTAFIQAFARALKEFAHGESFRLDEIHFTEALFVPDDEPREMRVELRRRGDFLEGRIRSRAPGETTARLHAQARMTPGSSHAPVHARATAAEPNGEDETNTMEEFAAFMARSRDIQLGPRWECLREIKYGPREARAHLVLKEEFARDLEHFSVHPSLLDVAMGFAYLRRDDLFLPLSYRDVYIQAPLPREIISTARELSASEELLRYQVSITDLNGRALMDVGEFTMRRVRDSREPGRAEHPAGMRETTFTQSGLKPKTGRKAFAAALALDMAQVIVSAGDPRRAPGSLEGDDNTHTHTSRGRPRLRSNYAPPRGRAESALEKIWSELLRIDSIGRDDNFFELGGDSLLAIRIIPGAREAGITITPGLIFEHPTIAELAAAATTSRKDAAAEQTSEDEPPAELENALLEVEFE